jgi:fermentation-respiration switch protein FrsA (DUF1100 family)
MDSPQPHHRESATSRPGSRLLLLVPIVAILLAGCGLSTRALFPARKLDANVRLNADPASRELAIRTADGVDLSGLYFDNGGKSLILYFHGNAGALDSWQGINRQLKRFGANLLMIDYRGYGKSGGKITEEGLFLDAQATHRMAGELGFADTSIVVYGRSIGTGIAVDLAKTKRFRGLILESPYSSIRKMVYREYWFLLPYFYFPYSLNSCSAAESILTPTLILHGTADQVIPYKYGRELSRCFDSTVVRFVSLEGGTHNDLAYYPRYWSAVDSFLRAR